VLDRCASTISREIERNAPGPSYSCRLPSSAMNGASALFETVTEYS